MENRKFIKFLVPFFWGLFLLPGAAFGYSVETHAFLTDEIVKFYNARFPQRPIPNELKNFIIDGSRREDDPPRWMNHFYDPVYERGLTQDPAIDPFYKLGNWTKSREWAQSSEKQGKFVYSPLIASILSSIETGRIQPFLPTSDFTWKEALRYWIQGDKEMAMFALGHILHLAEDLAVPDHARNDPHPGDSPYEKYGERFTLANPDTTIAQRLKGKEAKIIPSLDEYFKELAVYSNNNFYSKDTIGIQSGYSLPEIEYVKKDDYYHYGFTFIEGLEVPIVAFIRYDKFSYIHSNKENVLLEEGQGNLKITPSYWTRLSTKSIQYGAGIIHLFLETAEREKNNPEFAEKEKTFFAKIADLAQQTVQSGISFVKGLFGEKEFEKIAEISVGDTRSAIQLSPTNALNPSQSNPTNNLPSPLPNPNTQNTPRNETRKLALDELEPEDIPNPEQQPNQPKEIKPNTPEKISTSSSPLKECSFISSTTPLSESTIVLNEIAWMGTLASANDEWIEIKNISSRTVDVKDWWLLSENGNIRISFSSLTRTSIPPGGFLLLERTDDNSVPGVTADLIYVGALPNAGTGLQILDVSCAIKDRLVASSGWPAGDAPSRKTMERTPAGQWQTAKEIGGTPRKENSSPAVSPSPSSGGVSYAGGASATFPKLLISEVQIASSASVNDEFIEIYNPNDTEVDLSRWYLQKKTRSGASFSTFAPANLLDGKKIPPKGFFVIAHPTSPVAKQAATEYGIADHNTIVIKNPGGEIVDKVGWGEAQDCEGQCAPQPERGESIQRKYLNGTFQDTDHNFLDFEIRSCPSAGVVSSFCTQSQAPAAPFSSSNVNHLLISEIQIGGIAPDDEFIEIHNPDNSPSSLSGYSIQYVSGQATSTANAQKKNFNTEMSVPPLGFFLLAKSGGALAARADMTYGFSLSGAPSGGHIFLVRATSSVESFSDARIIDRVSYGNVAVSQLSPAPLPPEAQSIERKAYVSSSCVPAQNEAAFLGNGCDTDDSSADFFIQPSPFPQNTQNLPEPRDAPDPPDTITASHNREVMTISLSWDHPAYSSSGIFFQITETSAPSLFNAVTSSTTVSFLIQEVEKNYTFTVTAIDADGLSSSASPASLAVPSLLSGNWFYRDPRNSDTAIIDIAFAQYPFVPDIFAQGKRRLLIFSYDSENSPQEFIEELPGPAWQPPDVSRTAPLTYLRCNGTTHASYSLIFPDIVFDPLAQHQLCSNGGGIVSAGFSLQRLEDNRARVITNAPADPSSALFLSYYALLHQSASQSTFKLVAFEKTPIAFEQNPPAHQAPELIGNITTAFNRQSSTLAVSWPNATDSDSVDADITYEIRYRESEDWQSAGNATSAQRSAAPGDSFLISVRAKDEFGNTNENSLLSLPWSYPETIFFITQIQQDSWSEPFGWRNINCADCPTSAVLQSVVPASSFQTDIITVRIRQDVVNNVADVRLSLYKDGGADQPDFSQLLGKSVLYDFIRPDDANETTFRLSSPVSLISNEKYWLVLDVERYHDVRGYQQNSWRVGIASTSDYFQGKAGIGFGGDCRTFNSGYCAGNTIPHPGENTDWYFRVGKE